MKVPQTFYSLYRSPYGCGQLAQGVQGVDLVLHEGVGDGEGREGGGVVWSPAAISLQLFALLFGLCHCLLFVCLLSFRQPAARCPLPTSQSLSTSVLEPLLRSLNN